MLLISLKKIPAARENHLSHDGIACFQIEKSNNNRLLDISRKSACRHMEKEQRRIQRYEQGMPIRLSLRNGPEGPLLAGPTPGKLTNISASGAGITVVKIFIDNYHLFYSPRDNPEYILFLELDLSDKDDKYVAIPVRPVWLDRIQSETPNEFSMGVEFTLSKKDTDLKRLIHLIQTKHHEGGNWLRNLIEKIFTWK